MEIAGLYPYNIREILVEDENMTVRLKDGEEKVLSIK